MMSTAHANSVNWEFSSSSYNITFTYDSLTQTISNAVAKSGGVSMNYTLTQTNNRLNTPSFVNGNGTTNTFLQFNSPTAIDLGVANQSVAGSFGYSMASLDHSQTLRITDQIIESGTFKSQAISNSAATAVPEPEAYAMMLAGLGLVGFAARRKQKAA